MYSMLMYTVCVYTCMCVRTRDDLQQKHELQAIPEVLLDVLDLGTSLPQVGVTPCCERLGWERGGVGSGPEAREGGAALFCQDDCENLSTCL